jgi:flagellar P-ring protein precursor FlgI
MRRLALVLSVLLGASGALAAAPRAAHADRLKDLVDVEGFRDNALVGYGLVVGLQGTGDDASSAPTRQLLAQAIKHLGVQIDPGQIKAKNVAAVMVTGSLPAFARPGAQIDVTVSSIGTSKSLQGGVLLLTPMKGADLGTYALAQGSLSLGGFAVDSASGSSTKKNHATTARIPNGARVEAEAPNMMPKSQVVLVLRTPDFTTAQRIAESIDTKMGPGTATVRDPGAVVVKISKDWQGKVVGLVAQLEVLEAQPDVGAKVVIDERTGTVVVGQGVTLGPAAIAHGGLTVKVQETTQVSQPNGAVLGNSSGQTVATPNSDIQAYEDEGKLNVISGAATVGDVAAALNAIGVKPRDLVAIFQALKAAGALHAEIVVL